MTESRCLSSAEHNGVLKRCALAAGHATSHQWVEAVRADGTRRLWEWGDDKRITEWTARREEP